MGEDGLQKPGARRDSGRGKPSSGGTEEPGYRVTHARSLVTELLERSEECPSADDIHAALRSGGRRVGLATVYRTLSFLTEIGAVERFDVGDGVARFESSESRPEDHHHHLVCRKCHRVRKYAQFSSEERELMQKTERTLEERFGYRITGHRIYFEGVCPECRASE